MLGNALPADPYTDPHAHTNTNTKDADAYTDPDANTYDPDAHTYDTDPDVTHGISHADGFGHTDDH